ncbi:hypothetical protein [Tenacibaculum sp. M341]|uniref:hypothetical protein n=1 Tax=Tenacibaculum sp. M341 TaxID=2530339 RepID=UPI0010457B3E|nr:hypothetical protein [Tenacibaculum sp. M341]TCI91397.1 hypothetical protein EYW44_10595 [Tenacibaculum sp. M341]
MNNQKKNIFFISSLIVFTIFIVLFIIKSNDHKECEEKEILEIKADGTTVKKKEHHCKEKYNF